MVGLVLMRLKRQLNITNNNTVMLKNRTDVFYNYKSLDSDIVVICRCLFVFVFPGDMVSTGCLIMVMVGCGVLCGPISGMPEGNEIYLKHIGCII